MIQVDFLAPDRAAVWRTVRGAGGSVVSEVFAADRTSYSLWAAGIEVSAVHGPLKEVCRHSFTVSSGGPPVKGTGGGCMDATREPLASGYGS
jgi:hypothetical protein